MKKKVFCVLFAVVLVLSFGVVAVPVGAYFFGEPTDNWQFQVGDGTIAWSTDAAYAGDFSVALASNPTSSTEAFIKTDITKTVDITSGSFWYNHMSGGSNVIPHIDIWIDTDNNGIDDQWLLGIGPDATTTGAWVEIAFADMAWYDALGSRHSGAYSDFAEAKTDWNLTGDVVTGIGIAVGSHASWATGGNQNFYVDDLTINSITYDLEPRVINTDTSEGFNTIQSAIDAANPSDTINVAAGTYSVTAVIDVNVANLTISGASATTTTVDGSGKNGIIIDGSDVLFNVTANGVTIENLTIDLGDDTTDFDVAVFTPNGGGINDLTVQNSIFLYAEAGNVVGEQLIHPGGGSGVTITGNAFDVGSYNSVLYVGDGDNDLLTVSNNTAAPVTTAAGGAGDTDGGGTFFNQMGPVTNSTISGNTLTDTGGGVYLGSGTTATNNVSVTGNTFDSTAAWALFITSEVDGVATSNIMVTSNTFTGTGGNGAIYIFDTVGSSDDVDGSTITINNNNFAGDNSGGGVTVGPGVSGTPVDAEDNWWGDANGPSHASNPLTTTGDVVSDNVDFLPWLDAAYPGGSQTGPVVNSTTSAIYLTIQSAIDAANPSDTISVATGTYIEHLIVDVANLTIKSASGDAAIVLQAVDNQGMKIAGAAADGFTLGGEEGYGFTITGDGGRLIELENGPSDVEISYNEIDTTGSASMGVSVGAAGATDLTISDNDFVADGTDGSIWGSDVVNVTVSNNIFTGPGGYAVEFAGVTGTSTISGNEIDNYGNGVWVLGGGPLAGGTTVVSGLTISNNPISGCVNAIRLGHSSQTSAVEDVTVTGNTLSNNTIQVRDDVSEVLDMEAVLANNTFDRAVVVDHTGASLLHTIWSSIQDGIVAAVDDDTVIVAAGMYVESLVIAKPLTLQGPNVVISPNPPGSRVAEAVITGVSPLVLLPSGANVNPLTIEGFTFQNATDGGGKAGVIRANGISEGWGNVTIRSNRFIDNYGPAVGVWALSGPVNSAGWEITDNLIDGVTGSSKSGIYLDLDGSLPDKLDRLTGWEVSLNTIRNTAYGGIMVDGAVDMVISGNTIEDVQKTGIQSSGSSQNVTITGNVITGANLAYEENPRAGIRLYGVDLDDIYHAGTLIGPVWVTNNIVTDSYIGFAIKDGHSIAGKVVHVNYNNFTLNSEAGLRHGGTGLLDAKYNWWGSVNGPYHTTANPGVVANMGDSVSENVDFSPWLYKTQETIVSTKEPAYAQSVVLDNAGDYGWNTFSTPVVLDGSADTWADLVTLTGLDYSIAYRYDSANQDFVLLTDPDPSDYAITPGEGLFIKMNTAGSLPILYSTADNLAPPSRTLTVDWNLIGLASLEDIEASIAFFSLADGQVVSPTVNVNPGAVLASDTVYVGEGYWAYMLSEGTLVGSTTTPVKWVP